MSKTDLISQSYQEDHSRTAKKAEKNTEKHKNEAPSFAFKDSIGTDYSYKHKVVWGNAIGFLILHMLGVYGFILFITGSMKLNTLIWLLFVTVFGQLGVTVGAHRYYTHKCFKAKPLLRAILLLAHTTAGENSMFIWCRDHRLHHRYSDTDGDPHNAKRGFFFSHIGWLMTRKHPLVSQLGRQLDLTDLQADWMVMFQKKYYYPLYIVFAILIPVMVPVYYFGESWTNSMFICYFWRYILMLNATWLVNSAAHIYGTRPYDKNLQPVESWFVSMLTAGEGWHNYHHAFPWDYKAAELTTLFNYSADVIHFFEYIGLAWDLKSASPELVEKRILRTGDGTHYQLGSAEARAAVTAVGFVHPLNPSYSTLQAAPAAKVEPHGLPLFHEKDFLDIDGYNRMSGTG